MNALATLPWAEVYSPKSLEDWRVPAHSDFDWPLGTVRAPHVDLYDLLLDGKGQDLSGLTIYCDVLTLKAPVTISGSLYVFARLIEVLGDGRVALDRTNGQASECVIDVGEIVDFNSKPLLMLPVVEFAVVNETVKEISLPLTPLSTAPATRFTCRLPRTQDAKSAPPSYSITPVADLADTLIEGSPPRFLLDTQFQLACMLNSEASDRAQDILRWVVKIAALSPETVNLYLDASALELTIENAKNAARSGLVVPSFDHEVFRDWVIASCKYLESRGADWDRIMDRAEQTDQWFAEATNHLEDLHEEKELASQLLEQAKQTCEEMLSARAAALRILSGHYVEANQSKIAFDGGIELWRRSETRQAVQDLIFGAVDVLAQIPVFIAAGPRFLLIQNSTADGFRSEEKRLKNEAALDEGGRAKNGRPQSSPRIRNDVNEDIELQPIRSGQANHNDARFVNVADALPDSPLVDPNDHAFVNFRDAVSDKEREVLLGQAAEQRANKLKAVRGRLDSGITLANALVNAGNQTAKGLVKVAGGIRQLINIAEQAEALETKSADLLNGSVKIYASARNTELVGGDLVTGGSQEWNTLALDIDEMFESIGDGILDGVDGARAYRSSLRKLIEGGRMLSQAQLAVAKANTDAAQAMLRAKSASVKAEAISARIGQISDTKRRLERLAQLGFSKLVEAKRRTYLSLEAYRRAYIYYTLAPWAKIPTLPSVNASTEQYQEIVRDISGRMLTLKALEYPPQTMEDIEVIFNDITILSDFRAKGGSGILSLPVDHKRFDGFCRIRLSRVRVYLDGLTDNGEIDVTVATSGIYQDRTPSGGTSEFAADQVFRIFQYVPATGAIAVDGDITARFTNDFFNPTPFTNWAVSAKFRDGRALDLARLTQIRFVFRGEVTPVRSR